MVNDFWCCGCWLFVILCVLFDEDIEVEVLVDDEEEFSSQFSIVDAFSLRCLFIERDIGDLERSFWWLGGDLVLRCWFELLFCELLWCELWCELWCSISDWHWSTSTLDLSS